MEQKVKIRISERTYNLKAADSAQEEMMRKAADEINRMIDAYQSRMQKREMVDILSLVALNIGMECMRLHQSVRDIESDIRQFKDDTEGYLEDIGK
ncbi:MAG: cell division protein ZapA [Candidatus Cryptobacteroides sp.]